MEQRFIVDTCIFRDFYENRKGYIGETLGQFASEFFAKVIARKCTILFSDELIRELAIYYDMSDVNDMLNFFFATNVLVRIEVKIEERLEANKLSHERNLPMIDCLNAILARNYHAILISQDRHILKDLKDITKSARPQDIS